MDENVKNDAKQVMLVQNADDGRLQAVTGVDRDGNIQTADPTDQNVASLLNVNTQDSALEAFFKKFMEQAQNPVHTGIFVMTENALNKLIRIDFDPEILENYRIDPSERLQTQEQRQFEPLDVTKIDLADMEKKGIRTEKGEFNRWIKATNAVIRDIKKKIALLFDWIAEAKAELAKPQAPNLVSLLNAYYTSRRAGAYSQKGKVSNLKEMNETFNYLRANGIYSLEDLESRVSEHSAATESLKKTLDEQTARMKAIKQLYDSSAAFQSLKPVYDGLQKIKFEKPRAKYKAEHEAELKQFYAARRKLTGEFPDGKVDMKKLSDEYDELEQAHNTTYGEFKTVRDDLHRLWKVKSCVDTAARFNERTEEQKLQNRPQTRQKKEELSR